MTVLFKPANSKITIHKDILVKASPYFAELLAQGTNGAQTYEVNFPNWFSNETVTGFVHWAYYGAIDPRHLSAFLSIYLKDSWLLAHKLRMLQWQNRLIDALIDTCWKNRRVEIDELTWLIRNVPKDSKLFKLAWDQFAYDISDRGVKYDDGELKRLFDFTSLSICDILHTVASIAKREEPIADRTRYYETENIENADADETQERKRGRSMSLGGTTSERPKSD